MTTAIRKAAIVAALLIAGLSGTAQAQFAPPAESAKKQVEVLLVQSKVVKDAQGREQLVSADTVKPGDILEYKATYTNKTGKPVTGLVAELPIPEGLEYLPKTAQPGPDRVKVAAKDGQFAAEPLARVVNGKTETVPYNEYRSLRWTLGQLQANGVTVVSARARVEEVAPAQPVAAAQPASKPVSR